VCAVRTSSIGRMETGYSPVAARRHRDGGAVDVPSEVSAEGPKSEEFIRR
jgi:hypothetical protein